MSRARSRDTGTLGAMTVGPVAVSGARTSSEPRPREDVRRARLRRRRRGPTCRVPHHWRTRARRSPSSDGPLLYRRRLRRDATGPATATALVPRARRHLLLRRRVARRRVPRRDRGLLRPPRVRGHATAARPRDEHVLAIEVACPPQHDRSAKRNDHRRLLAVAGVRPALESRRASGDRCGSRRPGPVRIDRARVLCIDASVERGRLACNVTLDAATEPTKRICTRSSAARPTWCCSTRGATVTLADGHERARVDADASTTRRAGGRARSAPQPLCTLELDGRGRRRRRATAYLAHRRVPRGAPRRARRARSTASALFLKGASYAPAATRCSATPTTSSSAPTSTRALDANLDLLRVHTHIAPARALRRGRRGRAAPVAGPPDAGRVRRGVRQQAARQAPRDGRACSVTIRRSCMWCAHDAPLGDDTPHACARERDRADVGQGGARPFDRPRASRALRRQHVPVIRSSGAGDDSHLWFGWRHGDARRPRARGARGAPARRASCPRSARSRCRTTAEWMRPGAVARPRRGTTSPSTTAWSAMRSTRTCPSADAKSFDEWREATQAYQAALLQLQIEDLRRCKGTPCGGFAVFCLADPSPAVGFGLLDHDRVAEARATARCATRAGRCSPMVDPRTGQRARRERHPP